MRVSFCGYKNCCGGIQRIKPDFLFTADVQGGPEGSVERGVTVEMSMLFCCLLSGAAGCGFLHCRYGPVPWQHGLLFGLISGSLFLFAGHSLTGGVRLALVWIFLYGLALESYIDFRHMIILDEILLALCVSGLVYIRVSGAGWQVPAAGFAGGCLLTGLIYVVSKGGFGLGDVKFAAVLGIWLGFPGILVGLALAFLGGGLAALLLCALQKASMETRIPFGPFLSAGAFLSFFFSVPVLDWYGSLFM